MLRETADATRTLTQLLLRHCSLEDLVVELYRRLGSAIALCDENMRTLARHAGDGGAPSGRQPGDNVVPVDGADRTYGYLVVEGSTGLRAEFPEPLFEQAAMACALYFMREQATSERELRLSSQLLHDLLNQDSPATEISMLARRRIPTPEGPCSGQGAIRDHRVLEVAIVECAAGDRMLRAAVRGVGGVGGIDPSGGSGVIGLKDWVEALGGRFWVNGAVAAGMVSWPSSGFPRKARSPADQPIGAIGR